ncbi:hypothetical protein Vadar_003605 [Vaccinium darrowii]|uniref:Uncharacterized protein n=1 Tax=Vaccinium darrowii TaxID=229202 RepID=A0ACB7WXQ2_9ERIC|nr:hypothetical protein Vadar_003605 [Vaccinium darrowii]
MTASEEMAKVMVQNARESAAGEEFEAMMVLREFQKQNPPVFQVSQLEEDAVQWWRLIDRTLTWQEFRHLFMDKYFPLIFRHALEHDFLQLTQRGITVIEYEAEVSLLDLHSNSEVVHRALVAEQELDNEKSCQREKRQKENTQFIGRSAKKQRTSYADLCGSRLEELLSLWTAGTLQEWVPTERSKA